MKTVLIFMVGYMLMVGAGCAPTLVASSTPQVQTADNSYYNVRFEPLKDGYNFFAGFRLEVTNKTRKNLEIDWNKTRYLYNGCDEGIFVFMGIRPEDIKNSTIPPDIIPAGQSFSKRISPYRYWLGRHSPETIRTPVKLVPDQFQTVKTALCYLSGKMGIRSKRN